MDNKKIMAEVSSLITEKIISLNPSSEDLFLINNLIASYYRKRAGISNSATNTMACAFLWAYSKSNFLWGGNKNWARQNLSELFDANPKTVGDATFKIINALKIRSWDERFCKKEIMKNNPFDQFMMNKEGFIVLREDHLNFEDENKIE